MSERAFESFSAHHPAPHRERVSRALLFIGLGVAPLAWALQLILNYGLASHACFPRRYLREEVISGWDWTWTALLVINLVALVIGAVGFFLSLRNWRRTREEGSGQFGALIEAGEGRTRFLSVWGLWAAIWFLLGIAFNTIALVGVPLCAS